MNSFYKNKRWMFFLGLCVVLNGFLNAITINDRLLEDIIEPGQVISATFPENSGVIIKIEKNNFYIDNANIDELEWLPEVFQDVLENSNCPLSSGGELSMAVGTMERSWSRLCSGKSINLTANVLLKMLHCVLDAPHVAISGNKMDFLNCFLINTKTLNVTFKNTEWDCIIRIELHNESTNPVLFDGKIDLNNDQAVSTLVIANAKEMSMQFVFHKKSIQSFKSSQSETTSNIARNKKGILERSFQSVVNFLRSI